MCSIYLYVFHYSDKEGLAPLSFIHAVYLLATIKAEAMSLFTLNNKPMHTCYSHALKQVSSQF